MPNATEQQLVNAAQQGDKRAVEDLLALLDRVIVGEARRAARGRVRIVEDLTQEARLIVLTILKRFRGEASFTTYVVSHLRRTLPDIALDLTSAVRVPARSLRRGGQAAKTAAAPALSLDEQVTLPSGEMITLAEVVLITEDPADRVDDRLVAEHALGTLTPVERVIISAAYGWGGRPLNDGEIARQLGWHRSTVCRARQRAEAALRDTAWRWAA